MLNVFFSDQVYIEYTERRENPTKRIQKVNSLNFLQLRYSNSLKTDYLEGSFRRVIMLLYIQSMLRISCTSFSNISSNDLHADLNFVLSSSGTSKAIKSKLADLHLVIIWDDRLIKMLCIAASWWHFFNRSKLKSLATLLS